MTEITFMTCCKKSSGFWVGFGAGILFMAIVDISDLHVCLGECDGLGYDLFEMRKVERK